MRHLRQNLPESLQGTDTDEEQSEQSGMDIAL